MKDEPEKNKVTGERLKLARSLAADIVLHSEPLKNREDGAQIFISALSIAAGAFIGRLAKADALEEVLQMFAENVVHVAMMASKDTDPLKKESLQ